MESSLEQTDYDRLFELLEPDSPSTESGFQRCRLKLLKFFSWKRCQDPASLADETIVRLLNNVKQGLRLSSGKPYNYVYAIAVNVHREYQRATEKQPRSITDEEVGSTSTPERADGCQELCLQQLSKAKLDLLNQYYLIDREELGQKRQLTRTALRLRIHRIKQELRRCCEECEKRSAH